MIVHRYAYVLLPVDGDPAIVFPSEARYVGEHGTTWIERAGVRRPPWRVACRQAAREARRRLRPRLRDDRARLRRRSRAAELVGWDVRASTTRARSSRSSSSRRCARACASTPRASGSSSSAFEPGKTEREILAPCEEYFVSQGCGRWTMDMVLDGPNGGGAAGVQDRRRARRSRRATCVLPSLEIAGPGGHWVEVSRAICAGEPSDETKRMLEAYEEYYDAAPAALRAGRPRATRTAPSRRASPTAASTSATSPATRSG